MNREETKKKLVEELKKAMAPIEYGVDIEHAPEVHYPTEEEIAEALIEAGLRFTESLTATFNKMDLLREHQLVCRLANAEHRAEVAEKALNSACFILAKNYYTDGKEDWAKRGAECATFYREQAERELAEEGKDD